MKKIIGIMLLYINIVGCASTFDKTLVLNYLVLNYDDFGPQVSAYETIGMNWWQWDKHGSHDPAYHYPIMVVVYRGVTLQQVMKNYPSIQEKQQDYRYLSYDQALFYLNEAIQADVIPSLTTKLRKTKAKIKNKLSGK